MNDHGLGCICRQCIAERREIRAQHPSRRPIGMTLEGMIEHLYDLTHEELRRLALECLLISEEQANTDHD